MGKFRKLFRLLALALPLSYLYSREFFLWFAGSLCFFLLLFEILRWQKPSLTARYFRFLKMIAKEREARNPLGATYLFLGSFLTGLFFPKEPVLVGLTFLILADAVAGTVDRFWGKEKTFAGRLAYLFTCLLLAWGMKLGGLSASWLSLMIASFVALILETIPWKVGPFWLDDNLTVAPAVALVLDLLS